MGDCVVFFLVRHPAYLVDIRNPIGQNLLYFFCFALCSGCFEEASSPESYARDSRGLNSEKPGIEKCKAVILESWKEVCSDSCSLWQDGMIRYIFAAKSIARYPGDEGRTHFAGILSDWNPTSISIAFFRGLLLKYLLKWVMAFIFPFTRSCGGGYSMLLFTSEGWTRSLGGSPDEGVRTGGRFGMLLPQYLAPYDEEFTSGAMRFALVRKNPCPAIASP